MAVMYSYNTIHVKWLLNVMYLVEQCTTNLLELQLKLVMITILSLLTENTVFMAKLKNMVTFVNRPITWT